MTFTGKGIIDVDRKALRFQRKPLTKKGDVWICDIVPAWIIVAGRPVATMDADTESRLVGITSFTRDELAIMFANFKKLSTTRKNDGVIDKQEFRIMMNVSANTNSPFLDALFKMFDRDGNGTIDFTEFVLALAIYQNKAKNIPEEDKQKLFFKLYDIDGDGEISHKDLATILTACFAATYMQVSTEDIDALVRTTFAKYTTKPTINFEAFSKAAFRL